jgi:AraC-like DNA-binding protein
MGARPRRNSAAPARPRQTKRSDAFQRALLIPAFCKVFQDLRVSSSLWVDSYWAAIYGEPSVVTFEIEHGVLLERGPHNERCFTRARRERTTVIGKHAGFHDMFVPIVDGAGVHGFIVTGPFATARATSTDILERWRFLTGRQGHPADPEFSRYVEATLSTLVLEGEKVTAFRRTVERLADLLAGKGPAADIQTEVEAFGTRLRSVRFVENVWEVARTLVDESTSRVWSSQHSVNQLHDLGVEKSPDHVSVGLLVSREADSDPVENWLKRDAFQRSCVELGRTAGNVVTGRIGDHGVTFLWVSQGSEERTRRKMADLAERAAALARRRFGLALHFGVSTLKGDLPVQYQEALAAAESAMSRNLAIAHFGAAASTATSLTRLRQELGGLVEVKPEMLPARFDRFLEAVAVVSKYRLEPARAHLEAGFERLTEALIARSALEQRGVDNVRAAVGRAADEARTMNEIFAAYRRAVQDIAQAMDRPDEARHDRSLRRAEEYMRSHYAEPLTLERVARVAGFAPSYFSKLLQKRRRMGFVKFLTLLRIERAKELLIGTSLNLQRVAELSGLSTRFYLNRLFKQWTSETPIEHRRRAAKGHAEKPVWIPEEPVS